MSSTPVTPDVTLTFASAAYTYKQLGGIMAPGSPVSAPTVVSGTADISNISAIPTEYQRSSVFRMKWTLDGSNPLTSAGASAQPDFTGGFTPPVISVTLANYGSATSVNVKAAVSATNPAIVTDSAVQTRTLGITRTKLLPPLIAVQDRDVTLTLNLTAGEAPAGTRIFYTINGIDPGDNNGEPAAAATLYMGAPFSLSGVTGSTITISARAYPPVAFKPWFITSTVATQDVTLPSGTEVFVGGDFVNASGNPMRNIARLRGDGTVDPTFDTGTGASVDSLVGIVRVNGPGIIAGGDFRSVNSVIRPAIIRLRGDGSVDPTFDAALTAQ